MSFIPSPVVAGMLMYNFCIPSQQNETHTKTFFPVAAWQKSTIKRVFARAIRSKAWKHIKRAWVGHWLDRGSKRGLRDFTERTAASENGGAEIWPKLQVYDIERLAVRCDGLYVCQIGLRLCFRVTDVSFDVHATRKAIHKS